MLALLDVLDDEHPFRSLDPVQRASARIRQSIRLLLRESHVQPLLVVFEDLHWNDSLTSVCWTSWS